MNLFNLFLYRFVILFPFSIQFLSLSSRSHHSSSYNFRPFQPSPLTSLFPLTPPPLSSFRSSPFAIYPSLPLAFRSLLPSPSLFPSASICPRAEYPNARNRISLSLFSITSQSSRELDRIVERGIMGGEVKSISLNCRVLFFMRHCTFYIRHRPLSIASE